MITLRNVCPRSSGNSVVNESFKAGDPSNCPGFLDSSNRERFSRQPRIAEALEADREELEAAEKRVMKKENGKSE